MDAIEKANEPRFQFITLDIIGWVDSISLYGYFGQACKALNVEGGCKDSNITSPILYMFERGHVTMHSFPQQARVFIEMLLPLDVKARPFISELKRNFKAHPSVVVREKTLWIRGAQTNREAKEAFAQIVTGDASFRFDEREEF